MNWDYAFGFFIWMLANAWWYLRDPFYTRCVTLRNPNTPIYIMGVIYYLYALQGLYYLFMSFYKAPVL